MVQNVLIASLNKGQFPVAILGAIMLAAIWKMPSAEVSKFAERILEELARYHLIGDIFSIILILAWFFHAKFQRKFHLDEIKRISATRNELQEQQAGVKLTSSDKRK